MPNFIKKMFQLEKFCIIYFSNMSNKFENIRLGFVIKKSQTEICQILKSLAEITILAA